MAPSERLFKIKLESGRILGPIGIDRIRRLILKKQLTGTEVARLHPDGDWQDINLLPEIAELIIAHAEGRLQKDQSKVPGTRIFTQPEQALPTQTMPLQEEEKTMVAAHDDDQDKTIVSTFTQNSRSIPELAFTSFSRASPAANPTSVTEHAPVGEVENLAPSSGADEQPLELAFIQSGSPSPAASFSLAPSLSSPPPEHPSNPLAHEETVVLQRPASAKILDGKKAPEKRFTRQKIVKLAILILFPIAAYTFLFDDEDGPGGAKLEPWVPVRPTLPSVISGKSEPEKSLKAYLSALPLYVKDTTVDYKAAAERFKTSAALDPGNVKALAMLASSYLNLIDSSNKDENFFAVISRLIEMSRAKDVDLQETVIADVEFYVTVNKAEAAQNRIVEFTKTHKEYGAEMFYYLALAFYHRADYQSAARYLGQIPDNKAFSPKLFHLRGLIAEKLGDAATAIGEYEKAIKMNRSHAKSRLRIAELHARADKLGKAAVHVEYLVSHQQLLAPKDLAHAYFLHAQLAEALKKADVAMADMERAVILDRDNHDYLLHLYLLRAKAGEKDPRMKTEARMYFFLGEGEKLLKSGNYHEALTQFLQARQQNEKSPVPLVKIGDMFVRLGDYGNARMNYKLAAERAPNSIEIWSKYIDMLIQGYEWDEATKAMDKFRKLPVPQSAIDKAAADMYAKQGLHREAQALYRKAMARDSIDSGVYIAYAKSLMATRNFKEAPFFFALALRFDPLNVDALVGTAKCIANTEGIDQAISMLQDELQKNSGARAELLAAIGEFQIQKGAWDQAQGSVDQAMTANPDYAYPWKLQAQIFMNKEHVERTALDKALAAYQSYSDRNHSDPSGYFERYRIFIKKTEYEKASEELSKIYSIYPKYPNLHFYKGALYSVMGNHKQAIQEYRVELQNNPDNVVNLIALGKALVQAGDANQALQHFNKAMALAPRSAEAKWEAAYANYLMKNFNGAIALYQAALSIDTANPMVYKRLGLAYRDVGDTGKAAQAFRKYLEMEPDAPDKSQFERYK